VIEQRQPRPLVSPYLRGRGAAVAYAYITKTKEAARLARGRSYCLGFVVLAEMFAALAEPGSKNAGERVSVTGQ